MNEQININMNPVSAEMWYKGWIGKEDKQYDFWFISSEDYTVEEGNRYSYTINWWYKPIPKEIRQMENEIIEQFKSLKEIK
jgi:hypothetical protein